MKIWRRTNKAMIGVAFNLFAMLNGVGLLVALFLFCSPNASKTKLEVKAEKREIRKIDVNLLHPNHNHSHGELTILR